MTEFPISHMNEIIDDNHFIQYAQFEGKKIVPATYEPPVLRGNKESYYTNILEFAKEMFPLSKFAYATNIHRNELVIWNRNSRRLGLRHKISIIKS